MSKRNFSVRMIMVIMSLLLVLTGFAGCSKKTENKPEDKGQDKPITKQKLTMWSHWADETNKKEFIAEAVKRFKDKNSNFEVEVVYYQKPQLITALTTAFQSGTAPDIFYLEPAITGGFPPYVDSGFMYDLSKYIDQYIDPSAMAFAKKGDMTYLLPLEAYMPMLYFNKDILKNAGIEIPADGKFEMNEFKNVVEKIKKAGFTPFSAGTMDRNWAGSILLENIILRMAGQEKWQGIAKGTTAWNDPDVTAAIKYVEELVKMGAYSNGVASIKLGESHGLFFGGKYGMFPMKTFFGGRAFVPVDQGGMDPNFPLGIMDFPTVKDGKVNNISYLQIGGSFGVNAASKNAEKAAELLAGMAAPDMGKLWMDKVFGQTGIKVDAASITNSYFKSLDEATKGLTLVAGPMEIGMDSTYRDAFLNISTGFVAGQITSDAMIKQLEDARAQIKK